MSSYKDLIVYKKSFDLALKIQALTMNFPKEERYALIDQIRRSSRSVCVNIAEGFRKVRYQAHFIAKMTDADMENSETNVWLEFSIAFNYITKEEYQYLTNQTEEIGKLINHIIDHPEKYGSVTKQLITAN